MQTMARLDRLPSNCNFPPCCRDKIRYDPDGRQLIFQGHMALYEYQALIAASDDVDYTLAIDWLYRNCDRKGVSERRGWSVLRNLSWPVKLAAIALVLGAAVTIVVVRGR